MPEAKMFPPTFEKFAQETPYVLMDRFAGELRPDILAHRIPALDVTDPVVAFNMFGVAGADSWVHEGTYRDYKPAPMLFNWRVLLGLTAYGKPYLAELIERKHPALAALVWSVAERALKQYNVCTYEMYKRSLQVAYLDYRDPNRLDSDSVAFSLKEEEKPVFMHYYNEQLNDGAFINAVQQTFSRTYCALSNEEDVDHISVVYMERIRGERAKLPSVLDYPEFPRPPFGPLKPGPFLYELLYANRFRYRPGGVFILNVPEGFYPGREDLPPALVINFNKFLDYREANMGTYHKLQGKKAMSLYDLAICAAETFGRHYYGVLHDKRCGMYYEALSRGDKPMSPEELTSTFVMPMPTLKELTDAAAKYSVNYLVGLSTLPRKKRESGVRGTRRAVSAKSVLVVTSPVTPYLAPSEFRITHRYHSTLISPPWALTMGDVAEYFQNNPVSRVAQHDGHIFVTLDLLRRLPSSQSHMTDALYTWLRVYEQMNKFVFKAELKMHNSQGINKLVRSELGTKNVRFRPEEDDAILRLYRPGMGAENKSQLLASCFGRSLRSISMRATILRNELMAKGIYDLAQLPHGARTESILKEIRDAKKRGTVNGI